MIFIVFSLFFVFFYNKKLASYGAINCKQIFLNYLVLGISFSEVQQKLVIELHPRLERVSPKISSVIHVSPYYPFYPWYPMPFMEAFTKYCKQGPPYFPYYPYYPMPFDDAIARYRSEQERNRREAGQQSE